MIKSRLVSTGARLLPHDLGSICIPRRMLCSSLLNLSAVFQMVPGFHALDFFVHAIHFSFKLKLEEWETTAKFVGHLIMSQLGFWGFSFINAFSTLSNSTSRYPYYPHFIKEGPEALAWVYTGRKSQIWESTPHAHDGSALLLLGLRKHSLTLHRADQRWFAGKLPWCPWSEDSVVYLCFVTCPPVVTCHTTC